MILDALCVDFRATAETASNPHKVEKSRLP